MKSQTSFVAMGVIAAAAALGFATAGRVPAVFVGDAASPVMAADPAAVALPQRVHCYSGMKSDQGHLTRGWVCEPEGAPAVSH